MSPRAEAPLRTRGGNVRAGLAVLAACWRADRWRTVFSLLTQLLSIGWGLVSAIGVKAVVDAAGRGDGRQAVWLGVGMGAALGVLSVAGWTSYKVRATLEDQVGHLLDRELVDALGRVPTLEHHERPDLLDKLDQVRQSRGELSQAVTAVMVGITAVVQMAFTIGLLASVDGRLAVLPLFAVPSVVVTTITTRRAQRTSDRVAEPLRAVDAIFELATTPAPASELRVFGLGDELRRRHRSGWQAIIRLVERDALVRTALTSAGWCVFGLGFTGALWIVAHEVRDGRATAGSLLLTLTLASRLNGEVAGLVGLVSWLTSCLRTVGRFLAVVGHAEAVEAAGRAAGSGTAPPPDRLVDGIRFEGVGFSYPGLDRPVLEGVDLHVPAGTTVAVVGDNGAGKSTLVKLLCRFYEPTEGRITVDGVPLAHIEPAAWRTRCSAAFQDFARFELSALDAIGVGDLTTLGDEASARAALDRAAATDVLDALPAGLDTQLGHSFEGGLELSGGQWQKLALARAMARTAPLVLVLDEPTAALDPSAEHALFDRYAAAAREAARQTGAVTVFVSHRFSTVRTADTIVVVGRDPDGSGASRIVEAGTHDQLVALGGTYAELYELQAAAYR